MRVKVIKSYRDKESHTLHRKGTIVDISDKRYEEINSTSYGIFVEELDERQNEEVNTVDTEIANEEDRTSEIAEVDTKKNKPNKK